MLLYSSLRIYFCFNDMCTYLFSFLPFELYLRVFFLTSNTKVCDLQVKNSMTSISSLIGRIDNHMEQCGEEYIVEAIR